jgi:hypothetical protein
LVATKEAGIEVWLHAITHHSHSHIAGHTSHWHASEA